MYCASLHGRVHVHETTTDYYENERNAPAVGSDENERNVLLLRSVRGQVRVVAERPRGYARALRLCASRNSILRLARAIETRQRLLMMVLSSSRPNHSPRQGTGTSPSWRTGQHSGFRHTQQTGKSGMHAPTAPPNSEHAVVAAMVQTFVRAKQRRAGARAHDGHGLRGLEGQDAALVLEQHRGRGADRADQAGDCQSISGARSTRRAGDTHLAWSPWTSTCCANSGSHELMLSAG